MQAYKESCRMGLWPTFGAHEHWAKIEVPSTLNPDPQTLNPTPHILHPNFRIPNHKP